MLTLLAHLIRPLIKETQNQHQNELDRFISSKRPTTTVEVEYWQREYDKRQANQGWAL